MSDRRRTDGDYGDRFGDRHSRGYHGTYPPPAANYQPRRGTPHPSTHQGRTRTAYGQDGRQFASPYGQQREFRAQQAQIAYGQDNFGYAPTYPIRGRQSRQAQGPGNGNRRSRSPAATISSIPESAGQGQSDANPQHMYCPWFGLGCKSSTFTSRKELLRHSKHSKCNVYVSASIRTRVLS